ncbi:MAG: pilus assembly protein PilM [Planctomycetota bacterium]
MPKANSVAIDVGARAVRVAWVRGAPGSMEVVRALRLPPQDLASVLQELKNAKIPTSALTLGINGQRATLRYNLIPPVPEWRLEMIMKYETQEMAEKSGEPLSCAYHVLHLPESTAEDQVLLVGMGRESEIDPLLDEIRAGGGRVHWAVPHALGLYHAYLQSHAKPPRETVLLTDVGHEETNVVLVRDGRLIFARSVRFGGAQIDEAIAEALSVKVEQASKLKEGIGGSKIPQHLVTDVEGTSRKVLGQLASILQSSLTFCRAQTKIPDIEIDRAMVSGGCTRVAALPRFLQETLGIPVEKLEVAVSGESLPGGADEWATALGLAMSGADPQRFVLDLLPERARKQRHFHERTRWLIAGAGLLAASLVLTTVVGFFANSNAQEYKEQVDAQARLIQQQQQQVADAEKSVKVQRGEIGRVKREFAVGSFTGRVLTALQDLAPQVSLDRMETKRVERDGKVYLELVLSGRADHSERQGIAHLTTFENLMRGVPGVRRTSFVTPPEERSGVYEFKLSVSPDAEPPPAGRSKKKFPRRGRNARS